MLAVDYPLLNIFWTIILLFLWVAWLWLLIGLLSDIYQRHDLDGVEKALWVAFMVIVPFVGVLTYLAVAGPGIARRRAEQEQAAKADFDDYIRSVAGGGPGGSTAEIERAKKLLDSGAITAPEYERLKQKALTS